MTEWLAAPLFLLSGIPFAATLTRGTSALFLSPVISGVFAWIASILHVVTDLPILIYWCGLTLTSIAVSTFFVRPRSRFFESVRLLWNSKFEITVLAVTFTVGILSTITTPPPLGWDARSMWFAIPSWLNGPAEFYLTAQAGGAQTGWTEYPLFGPASFATLWQLMGVQEDLFAASRLSGLLVVSVTGLLASLLVNVFAKEKPDWVKILVVGGLLLTPWFTADGYFNNGYMDVLQGASVAATLISILAFDRAAKIASFTISTFAIFAATNIKQEGFFFTAAIVIIGVMFWAIQRQYWPILLLIPLLFSKVIWDGFSIFAGLPDSGSTSGMAGRIGEFFDPSSQAFMVLSKIFAEWFPPLHLGPLAILLAAALGQVLVSRGVGLSKWLTPAAMTLSALGVFGIILVTYAIGNSRDAIDWWLGTSYSRITSTFMMLVWVTVSVTILVTAPVIRTGKSSSKVAKKGRR